MAIYLHCCSLDQGMIKWMSKPALRAQTVDIADLPLCQDLLAKKRFNDRSEEFLFGQQPVNGCPYCFFSVVVADFGFRTFILVPTLCGGCIRGCHS